MVVAWGCSARVDSCVEFSAPFQNGEGNKCGRRMTEAFKESHRMCRDM